MLFVWDCDILEAGGKSRFISRRRPVTAVEIERAYNAAMSFRSKNPFALVVMKKSYVYYNFSPVRLI